ncbi:GGDEF domain-containing protein [Paenibacillus lutrae]|uniref:Diguanylate cyclase n=1 Tax=Paenibacillus lutrae TaxID=2078573 RepID=A0A7X3JY39_9BACL|nr:GGDEF domain-containing protein [Paenibacillus lutrae]MVO98554.1 diguanylate cyclase [Paenibacillus lutrae]
MWNAPIEAWGPDTATSMILVILALMLFISGRLYYTRRKKAYFSMTLSIILMLIHNMLRLYWQATGGLNDLTGFFDDLLQAVSFVLVNLGIYQLYNPTKRRQYIYFCGLIVLALGVSVFHFYPTTSGNAQQAALLADLPINLYMFVLIFVCAYMITPMVGQQGKFQTIMTLFFAKQTAHTINTYMFAGEHKWLTLAEWFLPIGYICILFLLLFDRIVELMQAIYQSSITDGLTKVYTRKYFDKRVAQYIRLNKKVAVLFSDIDNFKKLNDTKGHHMGDEMLKQVALIMQQEAEDSGIVGRYGGEELVVLITDPDTSPAKLAENIRRRIEEETIVTVSMGYSSFKKGNTAQQLVKQADEAMYKAKKTGKNKVVRFGA